MTFEEWTPLAALLQTASLTTFPKPDPGMKASRARVWWEALRDLPTDDVRAAIEYLIANSKDPVSRPAWIRSRVLAIRDERRAEEQRRRATPSGSRHMDAQELASSLAHAEEDVALWDTDPPENRMQTSRSRIRSLTHLCDKIECPWHAKCPQIVQAWRMTEPEMRCMYQAAWTRRGNPGVNLVELFVDLVTG